MMMLLRLLSELSLIAAATAAGLRADPIVGSSLQYLDGSDWTARAQRVVTLPGCKFTPNLDFNIGTVGENRPAATKEECCQLCHDDPTCVAGVLADQRCWFKTAADVQKPGKPSHSTMACVHEIKNTGDLQVPATVPGDLITDLEKAGVIGDPLFEMNFLNGSSTWNLPQWNYTKTFTLEADVLQHATAGESMLLVLDGVKMGAKILLNGKELGEVNDQFLRYTFPLDAAELVSAADIGAAHELTVAFDTSIDCGGRWMACTGGWDWAPYSYTKQGGANTFTKGIWKSVYVTTVESAAITSVVAHTFYKGAYPTEPLGAQHGGFAVTTAVHLWADAPTSGTITVAGDWGAKVSKQVALVKGDNKVSIDVDAGSDVSLWWPNGLGSQKLYNVTASFSAAGPQATAVVSASRRIGFRFIALVTGNDTDASYVAASTGKQGTDHVGMIFRVNGAAIFARGANMIPMEELEGRLDADAHRFLVQSAAHANFNMLRVWGGGMFLPDAFYDACDEFGILIYHDMQYAQEGHSPAVGAPQDPELRYQIRRLSSHPSIAIWDGCNECQVLLNTSTGIYASFVMTVVAEEDASHAIWPSCPARGWSAGVEKLTARPVPGAELVPHQLKERTLETHGPYQHGNGFPATNGGDTIEHQECKSRIPIQIQQSDTGMTKPNIFASEFGCIGMSSFESMSPLLKPEHWGLHAGVAPDNCTQSWDRECHGDNPMSLRNYPCDNLISYYFDLNNTEVDKVGEEVFKKQLYQCMISQALELKGDIETRRAGNTYGIIVWQYNEIWPTGGWGTIEYGTPVAGQVIGGRWKPTQYWYKKSIYKDVMSSCGVGGTCYVKNDMPVPFRGTVTITSYAFATGKATVLATKPVSLPAGPGVTEWFDVTLPADPTAEIITAVVSHKSKDSGETETLSDNLIPLTAPAKMALSKANVKFTVGAAANVDGTVDITVTTDKVAVYVTLTTLANGRFSDNAFLLLPSQPAVVQFVPFGELDSAKLQSSLRVEHVASYQ